MELLLIRHSITAGNLARRYVGRTDEGLCPEGEELARNSAAGLPEPELVYSSPMLRCRQTAELLFPGREINVIDGLQETDFGKFEYKTYEELKDDADYRAWLDSGGSAPIPGGESRDEAAERIMTGFDRLLLDVIAAGCTGTAALVAHGGTIMTLMSALGTPGRDYYGWQVKNCRGFAVTPDGERLRVLREL